MSLVYEAIFRASVRHTRCYGWHLLLIVLIASTQYSVLICRTRIVPEPERCDCLIIRGSGARDIRGWRENGLIGPWVTVAFIAFIHSWPIRCIRISEVLCWCRASIYVDMVIHVDSCNGVRIRLHSSLSPWLACYFLFFKFLCYCTNNLSQFKLLSLLHFLLQSALHTSVFGFPR